MIGIDKGLDPQIKGIVTLFKKKKIRKFSKLVNNMEIKV